MRIGIKTKSTALLLGYVATIVGVFMVFAVDLPRREDGAAI